MDTEQRESLAREVDRLLAALEEERARHVAGLEPEPALGRLFPAGFRETSRDAVAGLRADGLAPLARRVALLRVEQAAVEAEEGWRAAEASARVAGPDGPLSLCDAELALPREPDRARRQALAAALAEALEGPARHREAAAEALARARAEAGLFPDWGSVVEGDQLLAATDDAWRELLAFHARALGLTPGRDLARADLLRVLAFPALDGRFSPPDLAASIRAAAADLGLDLGAARIDAHNRARGWPGAHATGARVAYRPRGGLPDWQDLLDALGRALAAAPQRPHARDDLFAATVGRLLAGLCLEPRWLAERLRVSRRDVADLVRALALRTLLRLRADAAALRVATEVERGLSGEAWREGHREGLSAALHAGWDAGGARASRDADAAALACTLRGFAEGERLRAWLRERFDEDWWRNPRSREHLAGLLAAGRLDPGQAGEPAAPSAAAQGFVKVLETGGAG